MRRAQRCPRRELREGWAGVRGGEVQPDPQLKSEQPSSWDSGFFLMGEIIRLG